MWWCLISFILVKIWFRIELILFGICNVSVFKTKQKIKIYHYLVYGLFVFFFFSAASIILKPHVRFSRETAALRCRNLLELRSGAANKHLGSVGILLQSKSATMWTERKSRLNEDPPELIYKLSNYFSFRSHLWLHLQLKVKFCPLLWFFKKTHSLLWPHILHRHEVSFI